MLLRLTSLLDVIILVTGQRFVFQHLKRPLLHLIKGK